MFITLLVILYLGVKTWQGFQVGFAKKIVSLIISAVVFFLAIILQNPVGNLLFQSISGQPVPTIASMDLTLYRFGAFFVIFFLGKQISKIFKKWIPAKRNTNSFAGVLDSILGAIVAFIASYFFVYVLLSMANAMQNQWFIQQTIDSPLLRFIINDTPLLTDGVFKQLFNIGKTAG